MKELDLYQFLTEYGIEMRWDTIDDDDTLSAWIPACVLGDFTKMIEGSLQDGGREAQLCSGGFVWVDLAAICAYFDIEPERIFPKISDRN